MRAQRTADCGRLRLHRLKSSDEEEKPKKRPGATEIQAPTEIDAKSDAKSEDKAEEKADAKDEPAADTKAEASDDEGGSARSGDAGCGARYAEEGRSTPPWLVVARQLKQPERRDERRMRAEIQAVAEEIEKSLALLRRHL